MRKARVVGLSVVLVLLLPHGTANTPALTFAGCTQLFAAYPVPLATAEGYLPSGFEADRFTTDPTGNLGSVSLYVNKCAHTSSGADGDGFAEAWSLIRTLPPPSWRDPAATTHFFLFASAVNDPTIAGIYADWAFSPGDPGSVSLETTPSALSAYGVTATAEGPELGLRVEAANTRDGLPWGEQHIRFFGRGPDGSIGAVDQHILPGGSQSNVQVSILAVTNGVAPTEGASPALGRDFRWAEGLDSWRLTPLDLPPLT